jgi:hypothetical protein
VSSVRLPLVFLHQLFVRLCLDVAKMSHILGNNTNGVFPNCSRALARRLSFEQTNTGRNYKYKDSTRFSVDLADAVFFARVESFPSCLWSVSDPPYKMSSIDKGTAYRVFRPAIFEIPGAPFTDLSLCPSLFESFPNRVSPIRTT